MAKPYTDWQLKVIDLYGETHSFSETGRILGISKQRVHQIITGRTSPSAQDRDYRKKLIAAGLAKPKIVTKSNKPKPKKKYDTRKS